MKLIGLAVIFQSATLLKFTKRPKSHTPIIGLIALQHPAKLGSQLDIRYQVRL